MSYDYTKRTDYSAATGAMKAAHKVLATWSFTPGLPCVPGPDWPGVRRSGSEPLGHPRRKPSVGPLEAPLGFAAVRHELAAAGKSLDGGLGLDGPQNHLPSGLYGPHSGMRWRQSPASRRSSSRNTSSAAAVRSASDGAGWDT